MRRANRKLSLWDIFAILLVAGGLAVIGIADIVARRAGVLTPAVHTRDIVIVRMAAGS